MGWIVRYWFDVSFLLVCVASMLSFYGQKGWSLDLLACFRFPFMLAFVLYAVVYLLRRNWRQSLVCLLLLGFQLSQWVFYLPQYSFYKPVNAPVDLTVLQMNIWKLNEKPGKILALLDQYQPDIVAVEEYTLKQHAVLKNGFAKRYPFRVLRLGEEIALLSRVPVEATRVWWTRHDHKLSEPNVESAIAARMTIKNQPLDVIMLHTLSPVDGHRYHHQQFHMAMLEEHRQEMASSVILMGDLNATPWSWTFRRMVRQLGLIDTEEGTMVLPTWPKWFPLLPLDHVLYRGRLQLVSRQVLPAPGSDHLPVLAKFAVQ